MPATNIPALVTHRAVIARSPAECLTAVLALTIAARCAQWRLMTGRLNATQLLRRRKKTSENLATALACDLQAGCANCAR